MSNIDQTIQTLFTKLSERKAKVAELKAKIANSWKTNGTFRMIGATSTTNIQTASAETIEECATHMMIIAAGMSAAQGQLGRTFTSKIQSYTTSQWIEDFQKRLAMIDVREEEAQLQKLEDRLNQVLSPEERRRIEVEMLAKELGA